MVKFLFPESGVGKAFEMKDQNCRHFPKIKFFMSFSFLFAFWALALIL